MCLSNSENSWSKISMKPQHMATKEWTKLLNKLPGISTFQSLGRQYRKWFPNATFV